MDEASRIKERWVDPVMGFQVTLYAQDWAVVETVEGRQLWSSFGEDAGGDRRPMTPLDAIARDLARFDRSVRSPLLRGVEGIKAPGPITSLTVDRDGRWAAVGGQGSERWLVASTLAGTVRLPRGGTRFPHLLRDDVMVVDWDSDLVLRVDSTGMTHGFQTGHGSPVNSCTTDSRLLLTYGYGEGSPWLAFDRDGRLVFDFDRDMTEPLGGATMVRAGGYPDTADLFGHVEGERVAWKDTYGTDAQILDLADRSAVYLSLPPMFDDVPIVIAPDATAVAQVIPGEIWTVHGDGPIVRWAAPDLPRVTEASGGRLLFWDPESTAAVVFDPATAGDG